MKTAINAWAISQDTKVFRTLQEAAWGKFDETGLYKYEEEARYYGKLIDSLTDLAWHYECLANEGTIE